MENAPKKEQKSGGVPGWIFGILFLLGGIVNLFDGGGVGSVIGAILTLLLALFLLPPIRGIVEKNLKMHFKPGIVFLIAVVVLVIVGIIDPSAAGQVTVS